LNTAWITAEVDTSHCFVLLTCGHSIKCKHNYVSVVLNSDFSVTGVTHNAFAYGDSNYCYWT
jgi:hypothetical protein